MDWYAVHTSVGDEARADYWLRRQGVETWFPHHAAEWLPSNESGMRSELARRAFFPRYLFVYAAPEQIPLVNVSPGVSTVLYVGQEPFTIPEEVIEELKKRLGATGKLYRNRPEKPRFEGVEGQRFTFSKDSIWSNLSAQILEVLVDKGSVRALFLDKLLGASGRSITVPMAEVGELLPLTGSED